MKTIGFIACASLRNAGMFLKIHVWNATHIPYQHYTFGFDRSNNKGTLHVEQQIISPYLGTH
jgi:hypothetical protein